MLEWVVEITPVNPQKFLTPHEQIIKYCLKFLPRNCRHCAPNDCFKFSLCVCMCVSVWIDFQALSWKLAHRWFRLGERAAHKRALNIRSSKTLRKERNRKP
jgi:hypothetical protein